MGLMVGFFKGCWNFRQPFLFGLLLFWFFGIFLFRLYDYICLRLLLIINRRTIIMDYLQIRAEREKEYALQNALGFEDGDVRRPPELNVFLNDLRILVVSYDDIVRETGSRLRMIKRYDKVDPETTGVDPVKADCLLDELNLLLSDLRHLRDLSLRNLEHLRAIV